MNRCNISHGFQFKYDSTINNLIQDMSTNLLPFVENRDIFLCLDLMPLVY